MSTPTPTPPSESDGPPRQRPVVPWSAVAGATVLATIAAVIVLVVLGGNDSGADQRTETSPSLTLTPAENIETDDALAISFTRLDGTQATLADTIDGPTVVNFFASWCPPCIGEMPDFEAASQLLGDEVHFIGLAVQDRPEDAERIALQTGITYDWARDIRGDIAGAVGVIQMPTTMFLSADGTIIAVRSGALDEDALLDLIEQHLGVAA